MKDYTDYLKTFVGHRVAVRSADGYWSIVGDLRDEQEMGFSVAIAAADARGHGSVCFTAERVASVKLRTTQLPVIQLTEVRRA